MRVSIMVPLHVRQALLASGGLSATAREVLTVWADRDAGRAPLFPFSDRRTTACLVREYLDARKPTAQDAEASLRDHLRQFEDWRRQLNRKFGRKEDKTRKLGPT